MKSFFSIGYTRVLDEDSKINAQKFEASFCSNPDLREVKPLIQLRKVYQVENKSFFHWRGYSIPRPPVQQI